MSGMNIELTGTTQYYSVEIPEKDLVVTATYMEDANSGTGEWDFLVVDGDENDLIDELEDDIAEEIKKLI